MTLDKTKLKELLYLIGKSLGFLGIAFVLYRVSQEYTVDSFMDRFIAISDISYILLPINLASTIIGIFVWHMMLIYYSKSLFPYRVSYYFFCKTEIAKYLPGNIFHFVGRQLLAKKIDITQPQMMKISGLFTLLLAVATLLSGTIFLLLIDDIYIWLRVLMIISSMVALIATLYLFPSLPKIEKIKMNMILTLSIALQGIMMGIIISAQIDESSTKLFMEIVGIYIFSWLVGFVTPGASGGIGVREGAFIAIASFLHLEISNEIILFSVLYIRLINIVTDIITYASTYFIKDREYI
ncbi:Putative transmembrane protein HieC [hydrothermal vent metagenome]|uniref:Putative transmembrane protein HieC n=1 Tax=hydrothermal vent metagenome TaxID=652676 RepID=A0A1W1CAU0_9ZZZZ